MEKWRPPSRQRGAPPRAQLPKMPNTPRNPRGYSATEVTLRSAGVPGTGTLKKQEPAGDPPEWWIAEGGTRPEWAVNWGLMQNNLEFGEDYHYRFNVGGIGASYYSQFDFVVFDSQIAIEVQGEFWHYGQGSGKQATDAMRRVLAQNHDYTLIFIDENDALERPDFMVEEALRGIDHSKASL